jgi:hypothetical protein
MAVGLSRPVLCRRVDTEQTRHCGGHGREIDSLRFSLFYSDYMTYEYIATYEYP